VVVAKVVGGGFDEPSFLADEAEGLLGFEAPKVCAGGDGGVGAEEAVEGAGRHAEVVAERGDRGVDGEVVEHPGVGELPAHIAGGGGGAAEAEDFDFEEFAEGAECARQMGVGAGDLVAAAGMEFEERVERLPAQVEGKKAARRGQQLGRLGLPAPYPDQDLRAFTGCLSDAEGAAGGEDEGRGTANGLGCAGGGDQDLALENDIVVCAAVHVDAEGIARKVAPSPAQVEERQILLRTPAWASWRGADGAFGDGREHSSTLCHWTRER